MFGTGWSTQLQDGIQKLNNLVRTGDGDMGNSIGVSLSLDQVEAIRECERSLDELLKKVRKHLHVHGIVSGSLEGDGVGIREWKFTKVSDCMHSWFLSEV